MEDDAVQLDLVGVVIVQILKPHKLSVQSSAEVAKVFQVQLLLAIITKEGEKQAMPLLTATCQVTTFTGKLVEMRFRTSEHARMSHSVNGLW